MDDWFFAAPESGDPLVVVLLSDNSVLLGIVDGYVSNEGKNKKDKWLKYLMMIHGIFFIGCFVIPMTGIFAGMSDGNTSNGGVIALMFGCIYFLPIGILSFLHFDAKKQ